MEVDQFLEHHGIKGQKWGIRNKRRSNVTKSTKKTSSDYKRAAELRKKKHPELTNRQIEEANKRANLEQNFNRLNPDKVKKGRATAKAILAGAITATSVYNMVTSKAGQATISAAQKALKSQRMQAAMRRSARLARNSGQGTLF